MNFKSDNVVGVCPEIMQAVMDANHGDQSSYGADEYSLKLKKVFSDVFEKDVDVYLTSTGTASNSLALSSLVSPHQAIYCHQDAHLNTDECGAPEFYTGGAKLISIDGENGKMNLPALKKAIQVGLSLRPHTSQPGCVSLTQSTEWGTVYSLEELRRFHELAQEYHLQMHMDGARFANSLVSLNCTPADLTWKSGIDILSFGATKNGAMAGEAVVIFNHKYANDFDYLQKRAGQLMSKTRFFASQFLAYFKNDLWLKNAAHANKMAQALAALFKQHGFPIQCPVEANEIFVELPSFLADKLLKQGHFFYEWGCPGSNVYRFVTSCFTTLQEIESFGCDLGELNPDKK